MFTSECSDILRSCIVGLRVGSERRQRCAAGRQCAGLQKRASTEISLRTRGFLAPPLRLFSVFNGLLPRDEERRLYDTPDDENIREV